jgi:hypothetical protein
MKNNVMIDLETWGKNSDAVVVQVGAVYFDRRTGEIGDEFNMAVDAQTEFDSGFMADPGTLYWWFEQSKEAQQLAMGAQKNRHPSEMVFMMLNAFLRNAEAIWCHASFDAPIISHHLRTHGISQSFPYWAWKDLRTLVEITGVNTRKHKQNANGVLHDAIQDCKIQIGYCCEAFRFLEAKKEPIKSISGDHEPFLNGVKGG